MPISMHNTNEALYLPADSHESYLLVAASSQRREHCRCDELRSNDIDDELVGELFRFEMLYTAFGADGHDLFRNC